MCKFDCSNCNGVNGDNVGIIDTLEIDLLKQGNNIKRLTQYANGNPRISIFVDGCIKDEILWLLNHGIQTVNSCCGHGKCEPNVLINNESVVDIQKLGYTVDFDYDFANYDTMKLAYLKGKNFKNYIKDINI
jgi:hypothetical protein